MKRYLGIVLAAMFVFGFAASAFAIHAEIPAETQAVVAKGTTQITLGGELRFRGELRKNTDVGSNEATRQLNGEAGKAGEDHRDVTASYDGRVRLRLQADTSKNTQGVVHLESGTSNATDSYTWGGGAGDTRGIYNEGNAKQNNLYILEAWLQHKGSGFLGIPAGVKVGHMPVKLGYGLFFDHSKFGDDALLLFIDPSKNLHIGAMTIKFLENTTTQADDSDAYIGYFAYKGGSFNLGGDVTYIDAKRWGPSSSSLNEQQRGTQLYNVGLRGDTKIASAVTLRAGVEMQSGKTRYETNVLDTNVDGTNDANEVKRKGYAYILGLDWKAAPNATITIEHAYGSGEACNDVNNNGICDEKNSDKTFVTAQSSIQNYTYVYEYRTVATGRAFFDTGATTAAASTGIANTWYAKLGGNFDLTKDLNLLANLYYLRASKPTSVHGTITSATKAPRETSGKLKTSKEIGTEFDAKVTYKIDKNLVYFVEGGYLWTGAVFDYLDPVANSNGTNKASKDAYAVRHGLTLSF
ncbi:MAG: alginate export family protein [Nitrospirae bacterium]|nr:alginate export family protein [Nitrospirota bacterium]